MFSNYAFYAFYMFLTYIYFNITYIIHVKIYFLDTIFFTNLFILKTVNPLNHSSACINHSSACINHSSVCINYFSVFQCKIIANRARNSNISLTFLPFNWLRHQKNRTVYNKKLVNCEPNRVVMST